MCFTNGPIFVGKGNVAHALECYKFQGCVILAIGFLVDCMIPLCFNIETEPSNFTNRFWPNWGWGFFFSIFFNFIDFKLDIDSLLNNKFTGTNPEPNHHLIIMKTITSIIFIDEKNDS